MNLIERDEERESETKKEHYGVKGKAKRVDMQDDFIASKKKKKRKKHHLTYI